MKVTIFDTAKKEVGKVELPLQFKEPVRVDLIRRGVLALQSAQRQAYGASPEAGMRHSAHISKRRRDYKTSYGHGISRIARKIHIKRGSRFSWVGAESPQAVGGRRAFPPKAEKVWEQRINKKERRKAIRSAIAATMDIELVAKRNAVPAGFPFVLSKKFEDLDKTKQVDVILRKLGLEKDLDRASQKKVRAGKGKGRGRKYKRKKGVLLVVSDDCKLLKAATNLAGVDVVDVKHVNVEMLAPGGEPGRLTLWSEAALKLMEEEKLFM
ncbi:MAG: 50S ribosomal protein L4 [Candidatus Woesearchaeota archaeon]